MKSVEQVIIEYIQILSVTAGVPAGNVYDMSQFSGDGFAIRKYPYPSVLVVFGDPNFQQMITRGSGSRIMSNKTDGYIYDKVGVSELPVEIHINGLKPDILYLKDEFIRSLTRGQFTDSEVGRFWFSLNGLKPVSHEPEEKNLMSVIYNFTFNYEYFNVNKADVIRKPDKKDFNLTTKIQ